jgi:peptidoglycan/xylan/chitin deacetylase (PgdA/CDA1 family)
MDTPHPRRQGRRAFLAGAVVAAAEVAVLASGTGRALARSRTPVSTIPPLTPRDPMTALVPPLPKFIRSGPNTQPRVAITVDDMFTAANADDLNALLDVAKAKSVKLSLFPTGGALQTHLDAGKAAVWQRAVTEGHEIGNHTYSHANLTKLTDAQIRDELGRTRDVLAKVLGTVPYKMRLMRPPGGAGGFVDGGDPRIQKINAEFGYSMAMWTIDSNNTAGNASFADKVVNTAQNGSIALFHFATFSERNFAPMLDRLRTERKLEPTNITGLFGL